MTTFTCSYKIQADEDNNRLYLIIKGFLIDEYVKRAVSKIMHEVSKLKSGFDVIDDISELTPATEKDAKKIRKAQNYVFSNGAGRIVQVVKDGAGSEKPGNGKRLQPIIAGSIEEAEWILG